MNSWKLNSLSGHFFRQAICRNLKIHHTEIYKTIKNIDSEGIITTKNNNKFKLKLEKIK